MQHLLGMHDFIDPQLRNCLKNRKERNLWELGVALAIKDKLRSGDLFLSDSKRHTSFWNLISLGFNSPKLASS